MGAAENKSLVRELFAETAKGNGSPFVAALAEDVRWTIIGTTDWSGTYDGKRAVLEDLLQPLAEQLDGPNIVSAEEFVAEGDLVVVQGRNHSITKAGSRTQTAAAGCWS